MIQLSVNLIKGSLDLKSELIPYESNRTAVKNLLNWEKKETLSLSHKSWELRLQSVFCIVGPQKINNNERKLIVKHWKNRCLSVYNPTMIDLSLDFTYFTFMLVLMLNFSSIEVWVDWCSPCTNWLLCCPRLFWWYLQ